MFDVYLKCQMCQCRRDVWKGISQCNMNLKYVVRLLTSYCANCETDQFLHLEVEERKEIKEAKE